ncbi:tryptophan synthase beta subunit-like PLP-dependent enzyme [Gamsiella multidivaricata]|uniref:tryptophan synthase beta subunit-like PLP-dependent enzyme n=1 Tax=Gamsiella multidivaricata TaxID=101098 RepID=UPI002220E8F1|nr:tryptophan synthase beta subunit-like PLP-dependent enzyme [Gamsiella multidivaricata]KAI7829833.1 tryptophan synthase beta subunit-like PLP-dependent enzyme [Gamsiella multidivaricata]
MAVPVQPLHNPTPLLHSSELTRKTQINIWLKLENLQPSGSFKIRGLGHMCQKAALKHGSKTHLVCSSGGNAGLAVAYAGRQLDAKVTVVVPQSCSQFMMKKIQAEGAAVEVEGEAWDEADLRARTIVANDPHAVYIPPFDHPDIWEGNSTMISELKAQLGGIVPDAIVCSVGGGGLMNGVILGCQAAGWSKVPVLAVETHGANSFQQSVLAGELVTLPKITSIATSLGAKKSSAKSLELSLVHPVVPFSVSDAMAARACWQLLDDHRFAVEPACGASLGIAYTPGLLSNIFPNLNQDSNVVVIVCGGSNIHFDLLSEYKEKFGADGQQSSIAVRSGDQILLKMTNETMPAQSAIFSNVYKATSKTKEDLNVTTVTVKDEILVAPTGTVIAEKVFVEA